TGRIQPLRRAPGALLVLLLGLGGPAGCGVEPSCSDGIHNGGETDTDCGGPRPPCAVGGLCIVTTGCEGPGGGGGICRAPLPHCQDGVQNSDEADTDCGGSCPGCAVGQQCGASADCASGYCDGGQCNAVPRVAFASQIEYPARGGAASMIAA